MSVSISHLLEQENNEQLMYVNEKYDDHLRIGQYEINQLKYRQNKLRSMKIRYQFPKIKYENENLTNSFSDVVIWYCLLLKLLSKSISYTFSDTASRNLLSASFVSPSRIPKTLVPRDVI